VAKLYTVSITATSTCGAGPDAWIITGTGTVAGGNEGLLAGYLTSNGYTLVPTRDNLVTADANDT
jgi:hypothetical protein